MLEPRLRALTKRLRTVLSAAGARSTSELDDDGPGDDLDEASDDEIFDLIDKELGAP